MGLVNNGSSVEMDEDAEHAFVSKTGQSVEDYFKGSEVVKVSGSSELKKTSPKSSSKAKKEGGET